MEHDTPMETNLDGKGEKSFLALVPSLALGHQASTEDRTHAHKWVRNASGFAGSRLF
jgi:hypothetical protein